MDEEIDVRAEYMRQARAAFNSRIKSATELLRKELEARGLHDTALLAEAMIADQLEALAFDNWRGPVAWHELSE